MLLICMLISSPVFATKPDAPDKVVMNIFELGVRPDRDKEFEDVARQTISASVDHEAGTLAMYALQRSNKPRKAFMVELYENESAYRKHLNAEPYKAFAARHLTLSIGKIKSLWSHSFWATNTSYRMSEPLIIW